jgi:hypothetical protein
MLKNLFTTSVVLALASSAFAQVGNPADDNRGVPGKKGSLLIYPHVELRWADLDQDGTIALSELVVNTFVSITNDGGADVDVKMFFVQGDGAYQEPGGRFHKGWNNIDAEGTLTRENPCYWDAFTGRPGLGRAVGGQPVPSWVALDPGNPPGRPDPKGSADRVIRGFILAWASDESGDELKSWNQLSGSAAVVNYRDGDVYEYQAYAFAAIKGNQGDIIGNGELELGDEYDYAPGVLLLDFYADSDALGDNTAFSGGGRTVVVTTDLTLQIIDADLTKESQGPPTTFVWYDVHDQNELGHSGGDQCVTCWASCPLSTIADFVFDIFFLGTNRGKARIDGIKDLTACGLFDAEKRALLGVQIKTLEFDGVDNARSAMPLVGQGKETAIIKYAELGGGEPINPGAPINRPGSGNATSGGSGGVKQP